MAPKKPSSYLPLTRSSVATAFFSALVTFLTLLVLFRPSPPANSSDLHPSTSPGSIAGIGNSGIKSVMLSKGSSTIERKVARSSIFYPSTATSTNPSNPSIDAAVGRPAVASPPPKPADESTIHPYPDSPPAQAADRSTPSAHAGFPPLSSLIQCPRSVSESYASLTEQALEAAKAEKKWCTSAKTVHNVRIGRSWGSLSKRDQKLWEDNHCNEHMGIGKALPCNEKWGWGWLQSWRRAAVVVARGASNVTCFVDQVRTSTFCEMENVVIDFSKARIVGSSRSFDSGFLTLYGEVSNYGALPYLPGLRNGGASFPTSACDVVETNTSYFLSNDDIYNLGHYINDVMMVWAQVSMDRLEGHRLPSQLVNIDGLRAGGPAGGPAHRLMLASAPDTHGPYSEAYYHLWFDQQVKKAIDYRQRKVCFRRLVTITLPGVPWFWNDWGRVNDCSLQSSSPLYQSFNYFLRKHAAKHPSLAKTGLPPPPVLSASPPGLAAASALEPVHVVIEVRKITKKRNNHSSARYIRNLQQVVAALEALPGVRVTAQDFAALNFVQQIRLAHQASILVSMHGAGTTHIFHMALGEKNCCGLLELFPDDTIEFVHAQGYGNLARQLGLHTVRYVPPHGSTTPQGTTLEPGKVADLVQSLAEKVRTQPTCLHDVKDV